MLPRHLLRSAAAALCVTALVVAGTSAAEPGTEPEPTPTQFVVGTFNLLGYSHTAGRNSTMDDGVVRTRRAARILDNRGIEVVGFQEMQPPQMAEFLRLRGDSWGLYPADTLRARDGENSIAWRTEVWTLVGAKTVGIPYFDGNERRMPVVRLQHNVTGQQVLFFNVHNPATNRKRGNQDAWRREAVRREIDQVNLLRSRSATPVFVIGDFNDRRRVFCPFGRKAALAAANGGLVDETTCTLPSGLRPVDWLFATSDVAFSSFVVAITDFIARTTDHPVVVATATIAPAPVPTDPPPVPAA